MDGSVRRGAAYLLALGVLVALAALGEYWLGVVTGHPIGQDFRIYFAALADAASGVYDPYEPYREKFIYHPFGFSFISLFSWGHRWAPAYGSWLIGSGIAWIVAVLASVRALADIDWPGVEDPIRTTFLLLAMLGFGPFLELLHIGQINAFVVAVLLGAFLLAERGRELLAGGALAVAVLLKTTPLLFLPYFLAVRRYRVAATAAVGLVAGTAVAAFQFSPSLLVEYAEIVPRLVGEHDVTLYNESYRSVVPLLSGRVGLGALAPVFVNAVQFSGYALLAGLFAGHFLAAPDTRRTRTWLFMALVPPMVALSPLVWYHHSVFLVLPVAALVLARPAAGIGVLLLLNAERAFEWFVAPVGVPVFAAHLFLVVAMALGYYRAVGAAGGFTLDEGLVRA
ncbi:MAG: glycosyltransferase family 87 protein [Halobacteriales archaeon]